LQSRSTNLSLLNQACFSLSLFLFFFSILTLFFLGESLAYSAHFHQSEFAIEPVEGGAGQVRVSHVRGSVVCAVGGEVRTKKNKKKKSIVVVDDVDDDELKDGDEKRPKSNKKNPKSQHQKQKQLDVEDDQKEGGTSWLMTKHRKGQHDLAGRPLKCVLIVQASDQPLLFTVRSLAFF
jgi:hypothetical protein